MPYIPVPIDTLPGDIAEDAYAYIEGTVPGWLPSPGNLEAWVIEALAQFAGELRTLASLVPDSIFAYYGESILGLPPYAAVAATGSTTWTMVDALGYTVPAGTLVTVVPPASTDAFAFQTAVAFTVAPGSTTASGIIIRAVEAGAAASGLNGTIDVLDPLDFVTSVTLDSPTSGGVDAETSSAYLDRLSNLLTLLTPRPILPQDFAVLVQQSIPGIARATAIDLYDASTSTAGVPRCVTVAVCDAFGNPCSSGDKATADTLLQNAREVNFLAFVVDPTYTTIDVAFTVTVYHNFVAADVTASVIAALQNYLSPATWGIPPFGDSSSRSWINATKVRYLEVAEQINAVLGVHFINTLGICVGGGTPGTTDVTLTGVAPLPNAGAITGSATVET